MSAPLKLQFVKSAATVGDLPASSAEVAVIGRSNVGKSSLLNALARDSALAKVSSKPGRTQLLNCFKTPDGATLIDLPGYGYAASASKRTRAAWDHRMRQYLLEREGPLLVLLLVDGEIGPTRLDVEMLAWLRAHELAFHVVATKHDKVKPSKRDRRKRDFAAGCAIDPGDVLWVSAEKNVGLDRLRALITDAL